MPYIWYIQHVCHIYHHVCILYISHIYTVYTSDISYIPYIPFTQRKLHVTQFPGPSESSRDLWRHAGWCNLTGPEVTYLTSRWKSVPPHWRSAGFRPGKERWVLELNKVYVGQKTKYSYISVMCVWNRCRYFLRDRCKKIIYASIW